jgi:hypothetical protein
MPAQPYSCALAEYEGMKGSRDATGHATADESQHVTAGHRHPYGAARTVMMRSLMRNRHIGIRRRFLVYSVLILYVLVSVAALACGASAESVQHRHHAAPLTHSPHSLLCAFACHVNLGAGLSVGLVGLFVAGCWQAAYGSVSRSLSSYPRQWRFVRGPPSPVLFF